MKNITQKALKISLLLLLLIFAIAILTSSYYSKIRFYRIYVDELETVVKLDARGVDSVEIEINYKPSKFSNGYMTQTDRTSNENSIIKKYRDKFGVGVDVWLMPQSMKICIDELGSPPVESCNWSDNQKTQLKSHLGIASNYSFVRWSDAVNFVREINQAAITPYSVDYVTLNSI